MATASFFVNTVNEAPTVPTLNNPANGGQVTVLAPTLTVNASTDPDHDTITYEYAVFSNSGLTTLVTSTTGAGASWIVDRNLSDNTWYWWQAQARDVHGLASGWMAAGSFFVNDKGYNDPPSIAITRPGASEPPTDALSYVITWVASDPDSNPVISLFYDQTGSGYSGTVIATGMHLSDPVSSYTWDISGLANGTYSVYATIDDGTTAVSAYAAGSLVISRTVSLTITATAGMGGSIAPSGAVPVAGGSSQTFTITPNSGYRVQSVLVDGVDQGRDHVLYVPERYSQPHHQRVLCRHRFHGHGDSRLWRHDQSGECTGELWLNDHLYGDAECRLYRIGRRHLRRQPGGQYLHDECHHWSVHGHCDVYLEPVHGHGHSRLWRHDQPGKRTGELRLNDYLYGDAECRLYRIGRRHLRRQPGGQYLYDERHHRPVHGRGDVTLNQYTVSTSAGTGGSISPTSALVSHGSTTAFYHYSYYWL